MFLLWVLTTLTTTSPKDALFVCTARNLLGKRFSVVGDNKVVAEDEALRLCEKYSSYCYKTGCELAQISDLL